MGNVFAGTEIVEMGIQIEKNGRDFYNTLIGQSKNQKAQDLFKYLAGEEKKHIATFQNILNSLSGYTPAEAYPGEYIAYMNSLANEYVFIQKDKGTEIARNTKSDAEAVDLGIKFEEDSIVFYEGMKKVVLERDHKVIDELINQENDHLAKLTEIKKGL